MNKRSVGYIILTKEEITKRFDNLNLILLEDFVSITYKSLLKCKKCDHEFKESLNNCEKRKSGKHCPKCYGPTRYNNHNIDELLKNKNIERIGDFKTVKHKLKFRCLLDGYEWDALWLPIRNNKHGCPKCGKNARYTNETFDEKIKGRNLIRIGEYKNTQSKLKMKCLLDGYEWEPYASHIIKGVGCPKCDGQAKLTLDEVLERLEPTDIVLIGEFKGVNHKTLLKCKKCGNEWKTDLNHVFSGDTGCPKCYKKGEHKLGELIKQLFNLIPTHNKRLYFDDGRFFIFDYKFQHNGKEYIVEYNGNQHYSPVKIWGDQKQFEKQQERDNKVRKYCKDKGIILIEIPHWLTEEEQIKSIKGYIQDN